MRGWVCHNCCWPLPTHSFLGPSPVGLATLCYCLRFETSLFVTSYNSQGYSKGIWPCLHRGKCLLKTVKVKVMLWPTVSQPVCLGVKHPLGAYDQIFITVRQLRVCWCGVLSLTRERVYQFQLLLVLASAVILGSESCRTRDHILLSQIRDSHYLEGQVPLFISHGNRVAQLYPQALGSLFISSYDSQGHGRGVRTHLHVA
jgi:hypothetical protein